MSSRSEATFLQRRKTVSLFASMKGPTCCMEEDHMRKVFIEVCCKAITKNVNCLTHAQVFLRGIFWKPENQKCRSVESTVLYCKNATSALTFMKNLQQTSMKTLRMWSSSMPHVGPCMDANNRALFRCCKKDASEREYIWYPYTRGSESPSEKSPKKLVRGSLLSKEHQDRT